MARALRIEFENAVYHITSRGNRRDSIFVDDKDRESFLKIVALGFERFDAVALAYCLMGNHYHFVVQTRRANLSQLMRHINATYCQAFNRRHGLSGHVFQGRFKAIVVDTDAYLLQVCRYVDLNPVRAGLVAGAADWQWSSFRAHTGLAPRPAWLHSALLHGQVAPVSLGGTPANATADAMANPMAEGPVRYAGYVAQGLAVRLWDDALRGQIYLGSEDFAAKMRARAGAEQTVEIPKSQRQPVRQPLAAYFSGDGTGRQRDQGMLAAFRDGGYTQTAIAQHCGLSSSRVSRLIASLESGAAQALGASQAKGKM